MSHSGVRQSNPHSCLGREEEVKAGLFLTMATRTSSKLSAYLSVGVEAPDRGRSWCSSLVDPNT